MRRILAMLALVVLSAAPVSAQQFGRPPGVGTPGYRPPVNPILNLARPGNAAINYYGLVRPQIEGAQALQQLERQVGPPAGGLPGLVDPLNPNATLFPGATGPLDPIAAGTTALYPTRPGFFTHYRYYMNVGPGGGGGGGGGLGGGGQPGGFGTAGGTRPNINFPQSR